MPEEKELAIVMIDHSAPTRDVMFQWNSLLMVEQRFKAVRIALRKARREEEIDFSRCSSDLLTWQVALNHDAQSTTDGHYPQMN